MLYVLAPCWLGLGQAVTIPIGGEIERVQCWHHAGKYVITPRKFLRVVDWVDDREPFVSKNVQRENASAVLPVGKLCGVRDGVRMLAHT